KYDESEFDELGSFLADFLAGKTDFDHVLRSSSGRVSAYHQELSQDQVGRFEEEIPDIIDSVGGSPRSNEFEPAPPILRPNMETKMKVLTVATEQDKLNKFQMFLALSDRAVHLEGEFLRSPH